MSQHNKLTVIGITGNQSAGKATVGAILAQHCGYRTLSFADAVHSEICNAFHAPRELLTDRATKSKPTAELALERCTDTAFVGCVIVHQHQRRQLPLLDMTTPRTPKEIEYWWSTTFRRTMSPTYWTRKLRAHITEMHTLDLAHRFAITDVPQDFPDELELVRQLGGQLWQVTRYDTAKQLANVNQVLDNRQSIDHLRELVLGLVWAREAGLQHVKVSIEEQAA